MVNTRTYMYVIYTYVYHTYIIYVYIKYNFRFIYIYIENYILINLQRQILASKFVRCLRIARALWF